jgi:hypothetical protein
MRCSYLGLGLGFQTPGVKVSPWPEGSCAVGAEAGAEGGAGGEGGVKEGGGGVPGVCNAAAASAESVVTGPLISR